MLKARVLYIQDKCALSSKVTIHGPCRRKRDELNGEDPRTSAESSYTMQLRVPLYSSATAQRNNCPSSVFDDCLGKHFFRVLKR